MGNQEFFNGNIPWVTTPEIQGRYIPSKLQVNYVSECALLEAGGKVVPQGAVVIAAVGDLGLVAIASEPVVLNQQLHAFVCSELVNNEYLAYWLATQKPYMESIASKTTIPYMNKANCESIPVLVPPLSEQKKIAQILSTWDKAISTTEQLLTNSQQQKKALMQQLLTGKKRLLDNNGVRFSGEWPEAKLADLVYRPLCYGVLKPGENVSGGHPLIRIQDLNETDELDQTTLIRISDELHQEFKRTILNVGDLIMSIVGTLGKVFSIPESLQGANITRAFAVIGAMEGKINPSFLRQYLVSSKIQEWLESTATGNAQKVLNISAIKDLLIPIPCLGKVRTSP